MPQAAMAHTSAIAAQIFLRYLFPEIQHRSLSPLVTELQQYRASYFQCEFHPKQTQAFHYDKTQAFGVQNYHHQFRIRDETVHLQGHVSTLPAPWPPVKTRLFTRSHKANALLSAIQ